MTDQHVPATATHADMVAGWMQAPAFCAEYDAWSAKRPHAGCQAQRLRGRTRKKASGMGARQGGSGPGRHPSQHDHAGGSRQPPGPCTKPCAALASTAPNFLPPTMPDRQPPPNAHSLRSLMRRGTLGILAFWLAVMAVVCEVMERVRQPRAAVVAADGALVIPRGSDGHFRGGGQHQRPAGVVHGGHRSQSDRRDRCAGAAGGLTGEEVMQFRTANGVRQGRAVVAQSVAVGHLAVSGLRVGTGYTGQSTGDALLGQNFLQHFEVQMQRDRMVLRPHP